MRIKWRRINRNKWTARIKRFRVVATFDGDVWDISMQYGNSFGWAGSETFSGVELEVKFMEKFLRERNADHAAQD